MKAILVIDLPDGINADDYYMKSALFLNKGKHEFRIGEAGIEYFNIPLKPLPQKMKHEDEIDYEYGYIDGRNELIDEILGGTE